MDEFDSLYDEDIDAETVKALSHALELDYIEKWKVFAQMKLLERNFAVAETARVALRDQLIKANANVQILLKNYEEKNICLLPLIANLFSKKVFLLFQNL